MILLLIFDLLLCEISITEKTIICYQMIIVYSEIRSGESVAGRNGIRSGRRVSVERVDVCQQSAHHSWDARTHVFRR